MIKIEVLPGQPEIVSGIAGKTGKPYRIVKQAAMVTLKARDGRVFQSACSVQPPRPQPGQPEQLLQPGAYTLDPASFYVRNGDLSFSPVLVPVAAAGAGAQGSK